MTNVLPFTKFEEIASEILPQSDNVKQAEEMATIDVKQEQVIAEEKVDVKHIEKPIEKPTLIPFNMFGQLSTEQLSTTAIVIIPIIAAF
jgi:hypothetical protein